MHIFFVSYCKPKNCLRGFAGRQSATPQSDEVRGAWSRPGGEEKKKKKVLLKTASVVIDFFCRHASPRCPLSGITMPRQVYEQIFGFIRIRPGQLGVPLRLRPIEFLAGVYILAPLANVKQSQGERLNVVGH